MAVRNFYVEADIDGRKTMLGGGPRAENGGMDVTIYQRNEGRIMTAIRISCRRNSWDGALRTRVEIDGERVALIETER